MEFRVWEESTWPWNVWSVNAASGVDHATISCSGDLVRVNPSPGRSQRRTNYSKHQGSCNLLANKTLVARQYVISSLLYCVHPLSRHLLVKDNKILYNERKTWYSHLGVDTRPTDNRHLILKSEIVLGSAGWSGRNEAVPIQEDTTWVIIFSMCKGKWSVCLGDNTWDYWNKQETCNAHGKRKQKQQNKSWEMCLKANYKQEKHGFFDVHTRWKISSNGVFICLWW